MPEVDFSDWVQLQLISGPSRGMRVDDELRELDRQARIIAFYLLVSGNAAFFIGYHLINPGVPTFILSVALIGFAGSAVGALTSCLDRYAKGFERADGTKYPKDANGETFNRRIALWLSIRPFLGLIVAPVFVLGTDIMIKNPERFAYSANNVVILSFVGGLLAKSTLDVIKNLFKNIFRA